MIVWKYKLYLLRECLTRERSDFLKSLIIHKKNKENQYRSLISKIGLDRATHCCDEPVLKPIGGHLEKTTQSSVFVSKSYFEASEIGLECSQYVSFDNSKHKYY